MTEPILFSLNTSHDFSKAVAAHLHVPLSEYEERKFEDGEFKIRSLISVRGCSTYILCSLNSDAQNNVHEKLCKALYFIAALKDAGAQSVTLIAPYLCYSRKDRKTKSRDPIATRYIAQLLESVGVDRVMTIDVHNLAAYQNAFRCPTEHLEAKNLFAENLLDLNLSAPMTVVSPDPGGVKRANALAQSLEVKKGQTVYRAFLEKYRSGGEITGNLLVGKVKNRTAIIVDDLISSGATLARAAEACQQDGANKIFAVATHGVFSAKSAQILKESPLETIFISDTIPPFRLPAQFQEERLKILSSASLFGKAIFRLHTNGSIVRLLQP